MKRQAFTLIELLIVVAIIAILAAIAVPNFLEAQVRAKVSRVKSDFRALALAAETYHMDNNEYPEGTDNPANYPQRIGDFLGTRAPGFYTYRTRSASGAQVGRDFANITTPIAYISTIPTDPFAEQAAGFLTYCYRNAKVTKNGWVLTSFGPDVDILQNEGGALGVGTANTNILSTASDGNSPARLGDVNERAVISVIEGGTVLSAPDTLKSLLGDLSYDSSNGTISDGDIIYLGAGLGFPTE